MLLRYLILMIFFIGQAKGCFAAAVSEYHYVLEPKFDQGKIQHIKVNLYVNHPSYNTVFFNKDIHVNFPETIRNLQVMTPGVTLVERPGGKYFLGHSAGARSPIVQLSYEVVLPQGVHTAIHPGASGDAIYLTGWDVLLCPGFYYFKEPIKAYITWSNLPSQWKAAGHQGVGEAQYFEGNALDLSYCYFIAGKWSFHYEKIENTDFIVAFHFNVIASKDSLLNRVKSIISAENAFIPSTYHRSFYLLSFISNTSSSTYSGRAYYNGAFIAFPPYLDAVGMSHIMAHEYFHQWNPTAFYLGKEARAGNRWFTEGVTDYYADLLCWRQGLISAHNWIQILNEAVKDYYSSDFLYYNNRQLKEIWDREGYHSFPYDKGRVLALYINQKIKEYTPFSFDDFFITLLEYTNTERKPLGFKSIKFILSKYLPKEVLEEIEKILKKGKPISLNSFTLGEGAIAQENSMKKNMLIGINLKESLKSGRITAVAPLSAAEKAGLKPGQKIFSGILVKEREGMVLKIEVEEGRDRKKLHIPLAQQLKFPSYYVKSALLLQKDWRPRDQNEK